MQVQAGRVTRNWVGNATIPPSSGGNCPVKTLAGVLGAALLF